MQETQPKETATADKQTESNKEEKESEKEEKDRYSKDIESDKDSDDDAGDVEEEKSSQDDEKEKVHIMEIDNGYDDMDDNNLKMDIDGDNIPGAPFLDEEMVEAMDEQDEQIEKMAEIYARRTGERSARKQTDYSSGGF